MNSIPVEILHLIFIQLGLKDRLECMLVCRFWHDTLDKRSLFHTLYIDGNLYPKFMDMLECLSYRGKQVQELNLYFVDFDTRKFCNMLPNLRKLVLIHKRTGLNPKQSNFHSIYSTTKLEKLREYGRGILTRQLAMSNACQHLKVLELALPLSSESFTNVVSQLNNMPVLETLRLSEISVKLMDLEILHGNLGSIKYLNLTEANLLPGEIPHDVKPAALITQLKTGVHEAADLHTYIQFYKYINKKYPSLRIFERFDFALAKGDQGYMKDVYTKAIFPLYQSLGSKIDSFRFDCYCNGLDTFRKFDGYGIQLKDLIIATKYDDSLFLEELTQSDQAKYIQHLNLENILPLPLCKLIDMEALHTLEINCCGDIFSSGSRDRKTINFSQFIEAIPVTLFKLSLVDIDFTFNDSPLNPTYIRHLKICKTALTPDLAKIIESCFPKLSTLDLKGFLTSNLTISLPNHNLEQVEMLTEYKQGQRNGFLIKTFNDDKVRYFAPRKLQDCFSLKGIYKYHQVMSVSKEEFNDPLVLNFACASVKKLHFDERGSSY